MCRAIILNYIMRNLSGRILQFQHIMCFRASLYLENGCYRTLYNIRLSRNIVVFLSTTILIMLYPIKNLHNPPAIRYSRANSTAPLWQSAFLSTIICCRSVFFKSMQCAALRILLLKQNGILIKENRVGQQAL